MSGNASLDRPLVLCRKDALYVADFVSARVRTRVLRRSAKPGPTIDCPEAHTALADDNSTAGREKASSDKKDTDGKKSNGKKFIVTIQRICRQEISQRQTPERQPGPTRSNMAGAANAMRAAHRHHGRRGMHGKQAAGNNRQRKPLSTCSRRQGRPRHARGWKPCQRPSRLWPRRNADGPPRWTVGWPRVCLWARPGRWSRTFRRRWRTGMQARYGRGGRYGNRGMHRRGHRGCGYMQVGTGTGGTAAGRRASGRRGGFSLAVGAGRRGPAGRGPATRSRWVGRRGIRDAAVDSAVGDRPIATSAVLANGPAGADEATVRRRGTRSRDRDLAAGTLWRNSEGKDLATGILEAGILEAGFGRGGFGPRAFVAGYADSAAAIKTATMAIGLAFGRFGGGPDGGDRAANERDAASERPSALVR